MRFIKICIALIILIPISLIIALLVVPEKIDLSVYKTDIEKYIKRNTGYNVSLGDNLEIKLLPQPYFSANNIQVKSFNGKKDLFHANKVYLTTSLKDLLSFKLSIKKLLIENPSLYLQNDINNIANWRPKRIKRRGSNELDLSFINKINDVVISNISLIYENDLNGRQFVFSDGQFAIDGGRTNNTIVKLIGFLNDEKINLNANLDLTNLIETDVFGDIQISENNLNFKGVIDEILSAPDFDGEIKINAPKLFETAYNIMKIEPSQRTLSLPVKLEADFHTSKEYYELSNIKTKIDLPINEFNFNGDIIYKPNKKANDNVNIKLNIADFSNLDELQTCKKNKNPNKFEWPKDIIDFSLLKQIDLDLSIEAIYGFKCNNINADYASLRVVIEDKRLDVKQFTLKNKGGAIRGTSYISIKGLEPKGGVNINLDKFNIISLINSEAQSRISLPAKGNINLKFKGKDIYSWVESLNGTINAESSSVTTVGINLESLQSAFMSLFGMADSIEGNDIGSFHMTAAIKDGVIRTSDAKAVFPNVMINAKGKIDLGRLVMNFKVIPNGENILGFNTPLLIKGDLNSPIIIPDVTNMQNQGTAAGAIIGGPVGAVIGNVLGNIISKNNSNDVTATTNKNIEEKQKLKEEVLRFLQSE